MALIPTSTDLETGLGVLTEPTAEPVTLAQAKAQVGLGDDVTLHDDFIALLIKAARRYCEGYTRRSFIHTTWRLTINRFPVAGDFTFWGSYNGGPILLPRSPAVVMPAGGAYAYALPRVQYFDGVGALQTLTRGVHFEDDFLSLPPRLQLMPEQFWPMTQVGRAKPVIVDFLAGYGADASAVPAEAVQAILLLVSHWYQNREPVGTVTGAVAFSVKSLLDMIHDGGYP